MCVRRHNRTVHKGSHPGLLLVNMIQRNTIPSKKGGKEVSVWMIFDRDWHVCHELATSTSTASQTSRVKTRRPHTLHSKTYVRHQFHQKPRHADRLNLAQITTNQSRVDRTVKQTLAHATHPNQDTAPVRGSSCRSVTGHDLLNTAMRTTSQLPKEKCHFVNI